MTESTKYVIEGKDLLGKLARFEYWAEDSNEIVPLFVKGLVGRGIAWKALYRLATTSPIPVPSLRFATYVDGKMLGALIVDFTVISKKGETASSVHLVTTITNSVDGETHNFLVFKLDKFIDPQSEFDKHF